MTTAPPIPKKQISAIVLARRTDTFSMYLEGMRPAEIAVKTGDSISKVLSDIRSSRRKLWEDDQATLQERTAETAAIFRRLELVLWDEYYQLTSYDDAQRRVTILSEIRRCEEALARVRGLINSRVSIDHKVEIKTYDFQDKYPANVGQAVDQAVSEGVYKEIAPIIDREAVPEVQPYTTSYLVPKDDPEGVSIYELPDGSMIEAP